MKKSILKTVHESAKSLYDAGLLDVVTMHEFDAMCLPSVRKLSPDLEDTCLAISRLEKPSAKRWTLEELEKELDLED